MKVALPRHTRGTWMALLVACAASLSVAPPLTAQEQFFTQSGGRGLQNAKTNARLSKAETEIGVIQEDLKTIKPHARAELGNCSADGEKLRFDGTNWVCDQETDPTVQVFAKKALPTCTAGTMLGVVGGELGCSQVGFVTTEADPTVQEFAKTPLPTCSSEQFLTVTGGGTLTCTTDQQGITQEADPRVYDFARRDAVSVLPNCPTGELLTMVNGRLACRIDQVGITVEVDPQVQDFARKDNGQPALAACATGEVLRATTQGGKVVLTCENTTGGALPETLSLNDLSDVNTAGQTSDSTLIYSNGQWRAIAALGSPDNPLYLSQLSDVQITSAQSDEVLRWDGTRWVNSDDKVGTLTDTNWCRTVGTEIVCDRPPPLTCNSGELLSWDGTNNTWICTDAATVIGNALTLDDLDDVSITNVVTGQAVRWDGTGWVNSTIERILAGDTQIIATDTGTDGLLSFATDGVTRMAVTNEGRVGIGVMPASPYMLDVSGSIRASGNLLVMGNLNISGSQTIDGVIFANGGITLSGTVTSGNISATNLSATVADIRTLRGSTLTYVSATLTNAIVAQATLTNVSATVADINTLRATAATLTTAAIAQANVANISGTRADFTNNVRISGTTFVQDLVVRGNLNVSGSQTIDGVIFANGGIALSGTVASGNISATNLSATVADIRTLRVTNNQTVGGDVSVTGNVQANTFIGSGASLTNIPVSAVVGLNLDRISTSGVASGANLAMVVADQGTVSFTLAGNPGRAYLDSTLGLVAPGVSTTGTVSATRLYVTGAVTATSTGYFGGNVGIGYASTSATVHISNSGTVTGSSGGGLVIGPINAANLVLDTGGVTARTNGAYSNLGLNQYSTGRVNIGSFGATVGVAMQAIVPSATLHVSGTIRIANSGEACDANRTGAIRYTGGEFSFCRNGTAWETLTSIAQGAAGLADRITSGTTQMVVVSSTGFVSLTQAGTNTGWFDPTRGLVTLGVSATGGISGTTGYFAGRVGVGMNAAAALDVSGSARVTGDNGSLILNPLNNIEGAQIILGYTTNTTIGGQANGTWNVDVTGGNNFRIFRVGTDGAFQNPFFIQEATNNLGIGTNSPAISLTVVGEVQVANSGVTCNGTTAGAIRYSGGTLSYCNGTAWTTLGSAGAADWYGLSNIPTRIQNVSNGTVLSMAGLSGTNVSVTNNLTVGGFTQLGN
ncbi:MAG: hypothetical protein INF43_04770, partial [Alphaproteobacteria bacterium]|nr:hypothetical protein [Alphaproteobacteria bacterium]